MFTKGQKAYVASSDSRYKGFECTVVSVGKKYITAETNYGEKYRFANDDNRICEEWGIYSLHQSESEWQKEQDIKDKLRYIINREYRLSLVLTEDEIESIYNRLKDFEK